MKSKYHHGDLKVELIRTGLKMIQDNGIEKLSLRKLSAKCNVSEAAPYSHFKNKDELLVAMQEYVTQQLQNYLERAYESTEKKHSPNSILNMGKAYVLFFLQYPEYYTFLFSQPCVKIDLSMKPCEDSFSPFRYYKEKAYFVYRKEGFTDEHIKYGIIAMWAKVHGLAAIASMKYVEKDFEWENVLEKILVE
ncbi:MAG: TetR/AcrR family transcriptional regulator [Lachnospiraceae bacterium]|nr:TetR/AcrR family transcriptional regulator [Lachnospiraceae bacterium]